jgi:hypothetical protein
MQFSPLVRSPRQRARDLAQEGTRSLPTTLDTKQCAVLLKWTTRRVYNRLIGEPDTRKRKNTVFYQHNGSWYVNTADLLQAAPKLAEAMLLRAGGED